MLSQKLKEGKVHETPYAMEQKILANKTLDEAVKDLIGIMRAIELDETYEREEIERFVIRAIERHEARFYGMNQDDFDEYLTHEFTSRLMAKLVRGEYR